MLVLQLAQGANAKGVLASKHLALRFWAAYLLGIALRSCFILKYIFGTIYFYKESNCQNLVCLAGWHRCPLSWKHAHMRLCGGYASVPILGCKPLTISMCMQEICMCEYSSNELHQNRTMLLLMQQKKIQKEKKNLSNSPTSQPQMNGTTTHKPRRKTNTKPTIAARPIIIRPTIKPYTSQCRQSQTTKGCKCILYVLSRCIPLHSKNCNIAGNWQYIISYVFSEKNKKTR